MAGEKKRKMEKTATERQAMGFESHRARQREGEKRFSREYIAYTGTSAHYTKDLVMDRDK